jgi:hypothetical protein
MDANFVNFRIALHEVYKALKQAKSYLQFMMLMKIALILSQFFLNCGIVGLSLSFSTSQTAEA